MIAYELREDGIAIIRFDNGRLNVMPRAFHKQLYALMIRFLRDERAKVAILTSGAGQSFSAGDDIKELRAPEGDIEPHWAELLPLLPRDKPVIAAVRGYCLGQGFVYLLQLTDIRYAAPDACFGFPEIALGIGGAGRAGGLYDLIPTVIAAELCLTGDKMDATRAARCHLVNAVVPDEALLERALATAGAIARHPLGAIRSEMSPVSRQIGSRNVHGQMTLLEAQWKDQLATFDDTAR